MFGSNTLACDGILSQSLKTNALLGVEWYMYISGDDLSVVDKGYWLLAIILDMGWYRSQLMGCGKKR